MVRRPAFTEGRYLSEAVTLPRALLAIAVLLAVTVAIFGTLRFFYDPPTLGVEIEPVSVDRSGDTCWWVIDLTFTNPSEDAFTVRTIELPDVPDSNREVIGVLDPGGSRALTYRAPLPSCDIEPASLGADEMRFEFSPRGSRARYEQTVPAPRLSDG